VAHPLAHATSPTSTATPWPDSGDPSLCRIADIARDLREITSYHLREHQYTVISIGRCCGAWSSSFRPPARPGVRAGLMEKVAQVQFLRQEGFLKEVGPYLDVLVIADDMGTQQRPLIRPALYRQLVKPFHSGYIETIRRHTPAKIHMHACGAIADLVDDYTEIGVDVLNPMQVAAVGMSPQRLKARFAGRMAFWGGIDTQWLLPYGAPDEVRKAVRNTLDVMGRDGVYVLGAVTCRMTPENVWAMLEEAAVSGFLTYDAMPPRRSDVHRFRLVVNPRNQGVREAAMKPKERMRRALMRQPVDRIPVQVNYTTRMGERMAKHLGVTPDALPCRLGNHLLRLEISAPKRLSLDGSVSYDWWGPGGARSRRATIWGWPDPNARPTR
jgi:hypothetical protein